MKNLWIVNHSSLPPELGGLNRHFYFSRHLSQAGYRVRIITASAIHNTDINIIGGGDLAPFCEKSFSGVPFTFLKTPGYRGNGLARARDMLAFSRRFCSVFRRFERPDAICASSPDPFAAAAAVKVARHLGVPVILEVRDLWPESIVAYQGRSPKNPVIKAMYGMEKRLYRSADRLVFTMEGGADYIREKGWDGEVDLSSVRHINNGVDLAEFEACRGIPFFDADLNDPSTFKVVYAGSVRTAYHLEDVVDAALLLQSKHPDIRFLIWGDGDRRPALEARCREKGVRNVLFKGRVDRRHIPAILSKADATLLQLYQNGGPGILRYGCSPNKLFDYLAAGKPVIVGFAAGYDLVERYGCGMSASGGPAALAEAALRLRFLSPEKYVAMCRNAARAARDYDYRILAKKFDAVLREVL